MADAPGAETGIRRVRELRPDLVLMDLRMPRLGGLDAIRLIKKEFPDTIIVVLSVSDDPQDFFEAIRRGAQGYLVKNLEPNIWLEYLEAIVRGDARVSRAIADRILREFAQSAGASASLPMLTHLEEEILNLVARGLANKEIGDTLGIAEGTVKRHLQNILGKLHLRNRVELATFAVRKGLTSGSGGVSMRVSQGFRVRLAIMGMLAGMLGIAAPAAFAHEHRTVDGINMSVGWGDEPTYAGLKNSVQVILTDKAAKPITDLTDTLNVEVRFGSQTSGTLPFERAFGKTYGRPGEYRAEIIPTRPGTYSFHFVGTVHDQKIDETFTSSEKTFDNVQDSSEIQFPVKDPSAADLGGRIERLGPRMDGARAAASRANTMGTVGLIAGLAGIVLGLGAMRRKRAS